VWTVAPGRKNLQAEGLVFRIIHRVSSRLYLERLVQMTDVRAILADWPGTEDAPTEHGYRTYEQFSASALDFARKSPDKDALWLSDAVVFVVENAPVVQISEAALTAAESADYYPPLVGKRGKIFCGDSDVPHSLVRIDDCHQDEE
jgi:hypothetical protein